MVAFFLLINKIDKCVCFALINQLISQSVLYILDNINSYICTYLLHISLLFLICIITYVCMYKYIRGIQSIIAN